MRLFLYTMAAMLAVVAWLDGPSEARADLIVNGDFETGDFTGWTLAGDTSDPTTFGVDESNPHSPTHNAYFGPFGDSLTLSQSFATTPGGSYVFDYWLQSEDGGPSPQNLFSVSFGGTTLETLIDVPAFSYRNESFTVTATSALTTVTFSFRNDSAYFDLDDVRVRSVPEPGGFVCLAIGAVLACGYRLRRSRFGPRPSGAVG